MSDREYVLGTYDEEVVRLGLQHRVWRSWVTACWRRAGIKPGDRVLDVGAGPGYATLDLAEIVGASGQVVALELSRRFTEIGEQRLAAAGQGHASYRNLDLVKDDLGVGDFDTAWCRWVLSFVADPGLVIKKVADALRPGGRFLIHEYLHYGTWGFLPPQPEQALFCQKTMDNWRGAGGDPDIGLRLPGMLRDAGLQVVEARPILFTMHPSDYAWQWPLAWIESSRKRLVDSGEMTQEQSDRLAAEFDRMSADPESLMLSPSVIELVAVKAKLRP